MRLSIVKNTCVCVRVRCVMHCYVAPLSSICSAVEKVGGHEKLERDLGLNRKVGYLRRAVRVAHFVREIHADLLQHV